MDDLIRRQDAIDALEREKTYCTAFRDGYTPINVFEKYNAGLTDGIKVLKNLPSAHPEPRWIPCSERLPEELQEVNITWVNTNPESYYESIKGKPFTGSAVYYKGRWNWYSSVCRDYLSEYGFSPNDEIDDAIKVIAWMPLPKPWRGEANE